MASAPQPTSFQQNIPGDPWGQLVSDWVKVVAFIIAVGATPLLANQFDWFWAIGLTAGVVTLLVGAIYSWRTARKRKRQRLAASAPELLFEQKVPPYTIRVHGPHEVDTSLDAQLEEQIEALRTMHKSGLLGDDEFAAMMARILTEHKENESVETEESFEVELQNLKTARERGQISEAVYQAQLARLSASIEGDVVGRDPWILMPTFAIATGLAIILPAIVTLLVQWTQNRNPVLIGIYFTAPLFLLWVVAESFFVSPFTDLSLPKLPRLTGLLRSALLLVSVLLLWVFLGLVLALGVEALTWRNWVFWIFYTGAGLAVVGMILGTIAIIQYRKLTPQQRAVSAEGSGILLGLPGLGALVDSGQPAPTAPKQKIDPPKDKQTEDGSNKDGSEEGQECGENDPNDHRHDDEDNGQHPVEAKPKPDECDRDGDRATDTDKEIPPITESDTMATPGVFQLFTGQDRQFYFRLHSKSDENILHSEGYTQKRGRLNGIRSVQENALDGERYQRKESDDARFYFVLAARNHRTIATSKMYDSEDEREAGLSLVMRSASGAKVEEVIN